MLADLQCTLALVCLALFSSVKEINKAVLDILAVILVLCTVAGRGTHKIVKGIEQSHSLYFYW